MESALDTYSSVEIRLEERFIEISNRVRADSCLKN